MEFASDLHEKIEREQSAQHVASAPESRLSFAPNPFIRLFRNYFSTFEFVSAASSNFPGVLMFVQRIHQLAVGFAARQATFFRRNFQRFFAVEFGLMH